MLNKLLFVLYLLPVAVMAQERLPVIGKIYNGNFGINDVLVVNFSNQTETRTDSLGSFILAMKTGDLLIVSGRNITTKKIRYTQDLVKNTVLTIEVNSAVEEIEEVVIHRSNVTSASLGIPMGKKYTPAERRLATAGDFKPVHLLGLLAGSLQVDPILNAINGRTKRLKKEVTIEQRELLLNKLWQNYTAQEFTTTYKIPNDYTYGFAYYLIEDAAFSDALLAGNKLNADLQASVLSRLYLQNLANEQ